MHLILFNFAALILLHKSPKLNSACMARDMSVLLHRAESGLGNSLGSILGH